MNKSNPIGVLDSGLGGLSILESIWHDLPFENTIYLADSKYAPYGQKSIEFIEKRTLKLCQYLHSLGAKAIVIACNTATTNAIAYIRKYLHDIIIVGVEPGVKPALIKSSTKSIGVLATENTLKSDNYTNLVDSLVQNFSNAKVSEQAGYGLVECIENENISYNNQKLVNLCKKYIDNMPNDTDTVVLGCTHYPFLLPILTNLYPHIDFIETSKAITSNLSNKLQEHNLLNDTKAKHILMSSLDEMHLKRFIDNNIPNSLDIKYQHFEV